VKPVAGSSEETLGVPETSTAGKYACKHVFWEDGSYALTFAFQSQNVMYSRAFGITTHPH
jgi:hypothetical protein